jgi:hypothetical protein
MDMCMCMCRVGKYTPQSLSEAAAELVSLTKEEKLTTDGSDGLDGLDGTTLQQERRDVACANDVEETMSHEEKIKRAVALFLHSERFDLELYHFALSNFLRNLNVTNCVAH